jgi:hypothetical protein
VRSTVPGEFAKGLVLGTNLHQRKANDRELDKKKAFDRSGPDSKGPSAVMSDASANIAETRDDHAVDQIDGDVFEPVHLAGIP